MSVRGSFLISNISKIDAILILIFVSLGFVVGYNFHGMVTVTVINTTILTGDNIIITNDTKTGDFGNLHLRFKVLNYSNVTETPDNLPLLLTISTDYPKNSTDILLHKNGRVNIPDRGDYFVYEFNTSHLILSHIVTVYEVDKNG